MKDTKKTTTTMHSKPKAKQKKQSASHTAQDILNSLRRQIEFKKTILSGEKMEMDALNSVLDELVLYMKNEFETINSKLDALKK